MKRSDRLILVAVPLVALAVGFWLLVLGPKREEASELGKDVESLRAEIASAEAEVAAAEQAREAFPANYAALVSLGAAVPDDDDQATFVSELSELARRDSVSFRSFRLSPASGGSSAAAPPPPATTAPSATEPPAEGTTVSAAPPTEATAATLPLGSTVGPAGLPVTPYDLKYFGGFFQMADLFAALDARVRIDETEEGLKVKGRLMTIDGFSMSADPVRGFPRVQTDVKVTTYLVPAEQGIDAGATPAGPGPVPVAAPTTSGTDPAVAPPTGTTASVTP